jgi:alginate O-acetyltransferase complex protein AlgI
LLFSSGVFIFLFLPVALLGCQVVSRYGRDASLVWLSITSLFFYGYWSPPFLLLLLGSIGMNFLFSQGLGEDRAENVRSGWLTVSIVANLLVLTYFKYLFPLLNFFHAHGVLGRGFQNVILPLGISFFTFTQIAYLIDLRQGIAKQQTIVPYTVFVTFFPHLIAGPIIHPREMMPQLEGEGFRGLHADNMTLGLTWFGMGLAKKILIADRISPLADVLFGHPAAAGFAGSWLGSVAYAMQLYFDFSGYSDMALGLARMFNIEFPINFNSPYKASGIIDFWTRFHMTLTRYLTEYLYTPMLRWMRAQRTSRGLKSNMKAATTPRGFFDMVFVPSMYTMGIAGVWHGAGVKFLLFGLLHGMYLTINHAWRFLTPPGSRLHKAVPTAVMVVLTFVAVVVGLLFFRADSLHDALYVLGSMAGLHGWGGAFSANPWLAQMPPLAFFERTSLGTGCALAICFFLVWACPNTQELLGQLPANHAPLPSVAALRRWHPLTMPAEVRVVLCSLIVYFVLFLGEQPKAFLYFQF